MRKKAETTAVIVSKRALKVLEPETWEQVQVLFDELIELPEEQQDSAVASMEASAEVKAWLYQLLAGDRHVGGVIDEPIENVADVLLNSKQQPEAENDWIGKQLGVYRIVSELGSGGMSLVMLADRADGRFEKQVAIKLMRPGLHTTISAERLNEETHILAKLQHPNIAHLLDAGISDEGIAYIVMEYCPGLSLTEYCENNQLSVEQRLRLFQPICEAVDYAHKNLVVHRDLKPTNILVQDDGTPKLVDFGISGILNKSVDTNVLAMLLTPSYAAPEQFSSDVVNTGSDIYALGSLLYELLTNTRPFAGYKDNYQRLIVAKENNDYIQPSAQLLNQKRKSKQYKEVQGDLEAIVQRAMDGDKSARYSSAQAMTDDIERYLNKIPVNARDAGRGHRIKCWLQRHKLVAFATSAVLLSLVTGLAVALWQAGVARQQAVIATTNATKAEAVQRFLSDMFAEADPLVNQQRPILVNDLVNEQALRINESFPDQPEIKQTLQKILAEVQGNLGNHAQAQVIYEDLLSGLESQSASMIEQSEIRTDIAAQLKHQGKLDSALEQVEKAIHLTPLHFGEQSVVALREKASILSELRRNDEAVVVLEAGLEMRDQILELSNGEQLLGHLLADLSGEQGALGEPEKASAILDEAMSLYDRVYTSVHPELTAAHSRRATIERGAGQFENAVKASFIAAIQSNEMFGIDHSQTVRSYTALAVDLAYLTCYPEAIELYEEVVDRYRTIYGENNVLTGSALLNLAAMRRKVYDYEAALDDINRTLAIFSEQSEPVTDKQSFALGTKAQVLFALNRNEEAEAVHLEAVNKMIAALGADHPQAMRMRIAHGSLLNQTHRYATAVEYVEPVLDKFQATLGEDSAFTLDAAIKLAVAKHQLGDHEAVKQLSEKYKISPERIIRELPRKQSDDSEPRQFVAEQCDTPEGVDLTLL